MAVGAFLASAAAVCGVTAADDITLHTRDVRVRDVATLECLAPEQRERIGDLTIARLPAHDIALSRSKLAALVRQRAPILGALTASRGSVVLRTVESASPVAEARCFATAKSLAPQTAITRTDVMPTSCQTTPATALRFDRLNNVVRAAEAIPNGAYLGRLAVADAVVDAGAPLSIIANVGAVRIERTVTAILPSSGERVFVRDAEGRTFSAPAPEAQP